MVGMDVEFTYKITGASDEMWTALEVACERAVKLNQNFVSYALARPQEGEDVGQGVFIAHGHDQSAIKRKIVAPIRSLFIRAAIPISMIQLISTRIMPNGRSLTLTEGRTPKNTFTDPNLAQMMADYGATLKQSSPGGV